MQGWEVRKDLKSSVDRIDEERRARLRAYLTRANDIAFERECAAAGIDPACGVSPSLLALLKEDEAA